MVYYIFAFQSQNCQRIPTVHDLVYMRENLNFLKHTSRPSNILFSVESNVQDNVLINPLTPRDFFLKMYFELQNSNLESFFFNFSLCAIVIFFKQINILHDI